MSGAPRGSPGGGGGDGDRDYGHLEEQEDTSKATPAVKWSERYAELVEWRRREGHACVPKAAGVLGRWVARQRELKKKQQLQPEREAQLNEVGMIWDTNANQWEMRYSELVQWVTTHNHACVPIAQGVLGAWAAKQRQLHAKGKLSSERYERLTELSFVWDTPANDWNKQFNNLVNWKNLHGHTRVPFNDGILGWWVNTQRQAQRKNKLLETRRERLDNIGFCWNPQQVSRSLTGTKRKVRSDDLGLSYGDQVDDLPIRNLPLAGPPPGLQQHQQHQQHQHPQQLQPPPPQQQQQQHYMSGASGASGSGMAYATPRVSQHRLSPPDAGEQRSSLMGHPHSGLGSGLGQASHGQAGLAAPGHGGMGLGHGGHGHGGLVSGSGAMGGHLSGASGHGQANHSHLGRGQSLQLHAGGVGHGQAGLGQTPLPSSLGHSNQGGYGGSGQGQGSHGPAGHVQGGLGSTHGSHGLGSHGQGGFGQAGLGPSSHGRASHGQGGPAPPSGHTFTGAGGQGAVPPSSHGLGHPHAADAGFTTPSPPLFGMTERPPLQGKRYSSGAGSGSLTRLPFSYFHADPAGGLYETMNAQRNQYGIPPGEAVDGGGGAGLGTNLGAVGVGGTGSSAMKQQQQQLYHGGGPPVGGAADGGAAAGSTFAFGMGQPRDAEERVSLQRYNSAAFQADPLPPMESYSPPQQPSALGGTPPVQAWDNKPDGQDVGGRLSPLRQANQRPPLPPPLPSPLPPPRFLASAPASTVPTSGGSGATAGGASGGGGGGGNNRSDRERERGDLDRDRDRGRHRGSGGDMPQRPPDGARSTDAGRAADLCRSVEMSRNSSLSRLADTPRGGELPRGGGGGGEAPRPDPSRALDMARAGEYGGGTFLSRGPHLFPSTISTFSSHVGATAGSSGGGGHVGGLGGPAPQGGSASGGEFSGLDLGTAAYISSATTVTPGPATLPSPQLTPATIEQTLGPAGGGGGGGAGGGGAGGAGGIGSGGNSGAGGNGGGGAGGGHFEFAHWNPQSETVSPPRLAPLHPLPQSLPPLPPTSTGRTDGLPGLTDRFGGGRSGWPGGHPPRE